MCGIAGIIDRMGFSNDGILHNMSGALAHRGPDSAAQNSWTSPCYVGLAHRHLAILDTSDLGTQSMHFQQLSLVFNGEIYNFKALKKELEALHHEFQTSTDSEVLLHAYQEWGVEALHKLKGMFAFALLDRTLNRLVLARDRFGVKPLYCYKKDHLFLFASELKALKKHPKFNPPIAPKALSRFLQYGNVPAPETIFENTFKVMPGCYMSIDLNTLEFHTETYWSPIPSYQNAPLNLTLPEAKALIKPLLEDAVLQRTVSDVPIGLFLSGGYDSATTAGILSQHLAALNTFTVSVPDAGLNEGPSARKIAEFLGTQHTEIECTSSEALAVIPQLPFMYDEPFADSSAIPSYLVAKEAVKSVKVALSADGGDELFGGYNRYKYFFKIPSAVKHFPAPLGIGMEKAIQVLGLKGLNAQRLAKFSRLFGEFSVENYLNAMTQSMPDKELASFLLNAPTLDAFPFHEANTPLGSLMLNDTLNYLPNDILHKVDRATMAVGLEGREPFLDHTLLETLARLPDSHKCTGKQSKILLRHIAHDYIPEALLTGPKKGFAIPINRWMRSHLKSELLELSALTYLAQQGLFRPEKMGRLVRDFLSGKDSHALFVWYFYSFQIWYNVWIRPAK